MTTAARPTWNAAMGGRSIRENLTHPTRQKSQYDMPANTKLKFRQPGQMTQDEVSKLDMVAQLERSENGNATDSKLEKRKRELLTGVVENDNQDAVAEMSPEEMAEKKRRMLALDAEQDNDDQSEAADSDSDSDDDDDDDTEALMRELEKIKRERAEAKERQEREKAAAEEQEREEEVIVGNPLLAPSSFKVKRRWDDDVVFKNQTKGLAEKPQKRFINDMLRSDFHRKFMNKYIK